MFFARPGKTGVSEWCFLHVLARMEQANGVFCTSWQDWSERMVFFDNSSKSKRNEDHGSGRNDDGSS